jgi:hypothetical protein
LYVPYSASRLVLGHELASQKRLDAAKVVVRVVVLGLALSQSRARRGDVVAPRPDLAVDELELGLDLREARLVGTRIDDEEQVSLSHRLVVDRAELGERAAHVRGDADHVGAHAGVIGERPLEAHVEPPPDGRHRHHEDGDPECSPEDHARLHRWR